MIWQAGAQRGLTPREDQMTTQKDPSPSDFYSAFQKVVSREKAALLECWQDSGKYTILMLERILPDVARELGMHYHKEYWWLDAILYHEKDEARFDPRYTYAKYISVALEHENEHAGAADEMNKLQVFNAPLAVLITYPLRNRTIGILEKYAAIIQGADVFENASTKRRQLAIFGYPGAEWDAFVYHGGRFVRLTGTERLVARA